MAISSITYPARLESDGAGIIYYFDGGSTATYAKYNFSGASCEQFSFQPHPQTDPYTRPLVIDLGDFDNGTSLVMSYFTSDTVQSGIVTVSATLEWVDSRTRQPITSFTYRDGSNDRTFVNPSVLNIPVDLPSPAYLDRLSEISFRYYPSKVSYVGDTHVGDAATEALPFGCMFYEKSPGLYPIEDLTGVKDYSDMTHYSRVDITNGMYTTETGRTAFETKYGETGDGTNPWSTGTPSDKPFENDKSKPGGGYGGYHGKGDTTGKPGLPTSGVLSSGFIAMYHPTLANLQALGAKMWSDDFVDSILKLWNDPMEAIITLGLVPFTPDSTGSTNCQIGNYDTEISMPRVTSQYKTLSCGSVSISEYWGNALDYAPYTEAEIFLPFVGMKKIDIDDIMGKTVSVDYNVDLLGGEAIAYVTVDNRVLYDFHCNLMSSVPISSSSYATLYSGILRAASSVAVGAAAGGVGAAAGALTSAVNVVTSKHGSIERGSELSPNAGILGLLTPYIILHRPIQSLPGNFGHFKGYPSNITRTLSSVSGYTEVSYIHLDGTTATDAEREEIYALLKSGVIL